jgi:2-polyprenyl-3-methyl-5-hydroxy-6-metoxy-1,4-benzoquinol methylase
LFNALKRAIKAQGYQSLFQKLYDIVPDISTQYNHASVEEGFVETKVRAMHSFQVSLANRALALWHEKGGTELTLVDIGDSSGTHTQYLKSLHGEFRALSVNLDLEAVQKIKNKGLEAILVRAEELGEHEIAANIFLSFEMLEHLSDPIGFLKSISENTNCDYFVLTVPYLTTSRVSLNHIDLKKEGEYFAEDVHIFELNPRDWKLLFQHSGWEIVSDDIFLQYPSAFPFFLTKWLWKKTDYEGFYGVILSRNHAWKNSYKDW